MSALTVLSCHNDGERRRIARAESFNGLDYLEVSPSQTELIVYFLGKAPEWITTRHLRIEGGLRERNLRILSARVDRNQDPDLDDVMVVKVDRPGDFSTYTLRVVGLTPEGKPANGPPVDFDPRYASILFNFKASCPTDVDCLPSHSCDEPARPEPSIDYLAKDFSSFRRLILDRLGVIMPDWEERHAPDLGLTLVELLAYAGDQLSYFQDAVATEAYLHSARLRISVRRHARLVDYRLHEGCNARTWITMEIGQEHLSLKTNDIYFTTGLSPGFPGMVVESDLPRSLPVGVKVFEPFSASTDIELYGAHDAIHFHTWSGSLSCLPKGATRATLVDSFASSAAIRMEVASPADAQRRLRLKAGDVLVFEEVLGPLTGNPADADVSHRHAVRLTKSELSVDPVTRDPLVEVEWCEQDALPFPLCLTARTRAPDCRRLTDVSVARGNVLPAHHGKSSKEVLGQVPIREILARCEEECEETEIRKLPGSFRPSLRIPGLTFSQPPQRDRFSPCAAFNSLCDAGAANLLVQDVRAALPCLRLLSIPAAPNGEPAFALEDLEDPRRLAQSVVGTDGTGDSPSDWIRTMLASALLVELDGWASSDPPISLPGHLRNALSDLLRNLVREWEPRLDLLESGPQDRHFVAEIDDMGIAQLRFGDGDCGMEPDPGECYHARYLIGNGPEGNSGADAIAHIVFRTGFPEGVSLRIRNPIAAQCGTAPEPMVEAKLNAPHVFRNRLERAVTTGDYAAIVMRDFPAMVQKAAAILRWNGSRTEVEVAVDAIGTALSDPGLLHRIECHLHRYRLMGHDIRVVAARQVPLELAIHICVKPGYLRGNVKATLLEALGTGRLPHGRLGAFHPDSLSFGEGVQLSRLVSVAQDVAGVAATRVTKLERLFEGPNGEIGNGVLALGPMEIARLDNDPGFPEHGRLTLVLEGGR